MGIIITVNCRSPDHKTDADGGRMRRRHSIIQTQAKMYVAVLKCQKRTLRRRSALVITDTELKLMAAAAIIGDNNIPKNG